MILFRYLSVYFETMDTATKVWLYVADIDKTEYDYDFWYNLMPQNRQEKISRFRFEDDKKRGVVGWALICKALKEYAGFSAKYVAQNITSSPKGKLFLAPSVQDIECKPYFNIAHSGDKVICAVSDTEVGCDIEKKNNDGLKIAKRFFHETEYSYLEDIKSEDVREREFIKLWTMKEAFVKATGDGIAFPMNEIAFVNDKGIIKDRVTYSDLQYCFCPADFDDGYAMTVCVKGDTCSCQRVDVKYLFE